MDNDYRNVSYSRSLTSVDDEILCPDPHIDHPRDRKQGCAPSSCPYSNLEALSLVGKREYERTSWTSLFSSSWSYRQKRPSTKRGLDGRIYLGRCTPSAPGQQLDEERPEGSWWNGRTIWEKKAEGSGTLHWTDPC